MSQSVVWLVVAVMLIFLTHPFLTFFGDATGPFIGAVAGILGAELTGLALVSFFTRHAASERPRSRLVLSYAICNTIGALVLLHAVLIGAVNARGWTLVGIYIFYAVTFGTVWLRSTASAPFGGRSG